MSDEWKQKVQTCCWYLASMRVANGVLRTRLHELAVCHAAMRQAAWQHVCCGVACERCQTSVSRSGTSRACMRPKATQACSVAQQVWHKPCVQPVDLADRQQTSSISTGVDGADACEQCKTKGLRSVSLRDTHVLHCNPAIRKSVWTFCFESTKSMRESTMECETSVFQRNLGGIAAKNLSKSLTGFLQNTARFFTHFVISKSRSRVATEHVDATLAGRASRMSACQTALRISARPPSRRIRAAARKSAGGEKTSARDGATCCERTSRRSRL